MNKIRSLINFICDIYLYKTPMFLLYKPKMHKVKGREIRKILHALRPGDILLRTFDGYLNTFFIPGFWGHAGIYIGDDMVVHAVREGVVKEDVLDFCRTDQIALLRIKDHYHFNEEVMLKYVDDHIKREVKYDYEFKDNNGKVYCTEFVNICLGHIFDMDYEPKIIRCSRGARFLLPDGIFDSNKIDKIFIFKHGKE